MMTKRGRIAAATLLVVLLLSTSGGIVAQRQAQAIGPAGALLGRSLLRTISLKETEGRDRNNINKRRDVEVQEVRYRLQAVAVQEKNGWLSAADAARERERYEDLRAAIEERAKRERQVVSYQTRARIRQNLKSTLTDILKVSTGADPRALDFFGRMLKGEKPLAAALDIAVSGSTPVTDPRQQFRDLHATLAEVEEAAQALRGARGIALQARIRQAVLESAGLAEAGGTPPDDKVARLKDLEDQLRSAFEQIGDIGRDLFPRSEGIDRRRFTSNERWQQLDAAVASLEGPLAGRAILSGALRRAVGDVTTLSAELDVKLSPEQIDAIASAVVAAWLEERMGDGTGIQPAETPFEDLVLAALNEALAAAGQPDQSDADGADISGTYSGQVTQAHCTTRCASQCEFTAPMSVTFHPDGTVTGLAGDTAYFVQDKCLNPNTMQPPVRNQTRGSYRITGTWDPDRPRDVHEVEIVVGDLRVTFSVKIANDTATVSLTGYMRQGSSSEAGRWTKFDGVLEKQ